MSDVIAEINQSFKKKAVVDVKSGDTVRVHQRIKEGNKERIQVFQGLVIRVSKGSSHQSRITVRRIASGVGVEKSFLMHSPLIVKVEVTKRSKVRRNYLSYMRNRTGKSARLSSVDFDRNAINVLPEDEPESKVEDQAAEAVEPTETENTDVKVDEVKVEA